MSFALLYSLLQKRLLLKLCLTQVLFNKCRMQVKCLIWHDCIMFINKMLLIFCSVFTLYNWLITFSSFLFVFCSSTSAVFTAVLIMSLMIPITRHRWNCPELKYRICRSALALSSTLIHVLAHFQRTCSQIYFRFSSYLLRKPHLFVILTAIGWFRSLLTSMFRKANIRYLSDVYALSFEKYKGK